MEQSEHSPLYARIAERLEALGLSEREASVAAFGNGGTLRNLRIGTSRSPGVETFAKLAPVLQCSPSWLAFGGEDAGGDLVVQGGRRQSSARPAASVPVVGEVAAGTWRAVDGAVDEPSYSGGPIPADPAYPPEGQFAVQVRGQSINRIARDGAILVCRKPGPGRLMPKDDDLVIVRRLRREGSEVEHTAKRLRIEGNVHSLWPDSTDPKYQEEIQLGTDDGDETVTVEIIGIMSLVVERVGRDISDTRR